MANEHPDKKNATPEDGDTASEPSKRKVLPDGIRMTRDVNYSYIPITGALDTDEFNSYNINMIEDSTNLPRSLLTVKLTDLKSSIDEVAKRYHQQRAMYDAEVKKGNQTAEQLEEVQKSAAELQRKLTLWDLLWSVEPSAHPRLLSDDEFVDKFQQSNCPAFVASIDIRRSTELMLKARDPERFAEFVNRLCHTLKNIVWKYHGIFDKFTGDGILAFFPKFYSGEDACYLALKAAEECHAAFESIYREHRRCFDSVLNDTGLGIGIDYGEVQLVRQLGTITVVGKAVVYACRLGGAPPGRTYLNQRAYEEATTSLKDICDFPEEEIEIKHEGKMLAYHVKLRGIEKQTVCQPDWLVEDGKK